MIKDQIARMEDRITNDDVELLLLLVADAPRFTLIGACHLGSNTDAFKL